MVGHGFAAAMGAVYTTEGLIPLLFSWHFSSEDPDVLHLTMMPPGPCDCDTCGGDRRTVTISRDAVDRAFSVPSAWSHDGEFALLVREMTSGNLLAHLTVPTLENNLCSLVMEAEPLERLITSAFAPDGQVVDLSGLDEEIAELLKEEQP